MWKRLTRHNQTASNTISLLLTISLLVGILSLAGIVAADDDDATGTITQEEPGTGNDPGEPEYIPPSGDPEEPEDTTPGETDETDETDESGEPDETDGTDENDENDEEEEEEEPEDLIVEETGSISGFLWADGNGTLETDWDGFFNGDEQPLADYEVYLYAAGDLTAVIAAAVTESDGTYIFSGLAPGAYVVGLEDGYAGEVPYLTPMIVTEESVFSIDPDLSDSEPPYTARAFSETISLAAEQYAEDINAGMRLPMGYMVEPENEQSSISGFLWVDGNGMLATDWDGYYNGNERPLADFPVYLYAAADLTSVIAATVTGPGGTYIFNDLEPGEYVAGIEDGYANSVHYLAPMFVTAESVFAVNWDLSDSDPPYTARAFTETISLGEKQAVENINAGMRLPMGVVPSANVQLANLASANVNDTVTIDSRQWVVVRKQTVGTAPDAITCVYLITRESVYSSVQFGTSSNNYGTSLLRDRMNSLYASNLMPTIRAIAVQPILGNHSSESAVTTPTGVMAGSQTTDIMFAPSYRDIVNWIGGSNTIPQNHPLHSNANPRFPTRFFCRTATSNPNHVWGVLVTANSMDGGIHYLGYSNINDCPAVWVNGNAVIRDVNVYYVDTFGNPVGTPNSATYTVTVGDPFTLASSQIPAIPNYGYIQWKKGLTGTPQSGNPPSPTLTAAEVISGTDIYLIFDKVSTDVTISKTVTGDYANYAKNWEFTIVLMQSGGTLPLTGTFTVDYSDGSTGTLVPGGSIFLKHGQSAVIRNVPVTAGIRIVEAPDSLYDASFFDSGTGASESGRDTGPALRTVGAVPRFFDFTNIRTTTPISGVKGSGERSVDILISVGLIVMSGAALALMPRRKRAGGCGGYAG